MNHEDIRLESIEKHLTFETLSRDLELLDKDSLLKFARCYIKLYLKQQEVLKSLPPIDKPQV